MVAANAWQRTQTQPTLAFEAPLMTMTLTSLLNNYLYRSDQHLFPTILWPLIWMIQYKSDQDLFPITLVTLYVLSNHSLLNDSNRLDQDLISDKSDEGWINLKLSDIVNVRGCLQSVTCTQSFNFPLIPHLLLRTLLKVRFFCFISSFLGGEFFLVQSVCVAPVFLKSYTWGAILEDNNFQELFSWAPCCFNGRDWLLQLLVLDDTFDLAVGLGGVEYTSVFCLSTTLMQTICRDGKTCRYCKYICAISLGCAIFLAVHAHCIIWNNNLFHAFSISDDLCHLVEGRIWSFKHYADSGM